MNLQRWVGPALVLSFGAWGATGLGDKSLWLDELVTSYVVVDMPLSETLALSKIFNNWNMVAHELALNLWVRAAGQSEFGLRFPSLLAMGACGWMLMSLAHRAFEPKAAMWVGFCFFGNPYVMRFAQEARGYAFAVLFSTLAVWFVWEALAHRRTIAWLGFVLTGIAGIYSHGLVLVVLGSLGVAFLVCPRKGVQWLAGAGAFLAVALAGLPLFLANTSNQLSWMKPMTAASLLEISRETTGGSLLALVVSVVLAAWWLLRAPRPEGSPSHGRWSKHLVVLWLCMTPLLLAVVALLGTRLNTPRYYVLLVPPLALAMGLGLTASRPAVRWGLVTLLVVAFGYGQLVWAKHNKEDWRRVAQLLREQAQPGDALAFDSLVLRMVFDTYLRPPGVDLSRMPESVVPPVPWTKSPLPSPLDANAARLRLFSRRRIWFVENRKDLLPGLRNGLDLSVELPQHAKLSESWEFKETGNHDLFENPESRVVRLSLWEPRTD